MNRIGLPVYFRVAKTGGNQPIDSLGLRGLVGVACLGFLPITDEPRLYGEVRRVVSAWHMLTNNR